MAGRRSYLPSGQVACRRRQARRCLVGEKGFWLSLGAPRKQWLRWEGPRIDGASPAVALDWLGPSFLRGSLADPAPSSFRISPPLPLFLAFAAHCDKASKTSSTSRPVSSSPHPKDTTAAPGMHSGLGLGEFQALAPSAQRPCTPPVIGTHLAQLGLVIPTTGRSVGKGRSSAN